MRLHKGSLVTRKMTMQKEVFLLADYFGFYNSHPVPGPQTITKK